MTSVVMAVLLVFLRLCRYTIHLQFKEGSHPLSKLSKMLLKLLISLQHNVWCSYTTFVLVTLCCNVMRTKYLIYIVATHKFTRLTCVLPRIVVKKMLVLETRLDVVDMNQKHFRLAHHDS